MLGKIIEKNIQSTALANYRTQLDHGAFHHLHRIFFVKTGKKAGEKQYAVVSLNVLQRIAAVLVDHLTPFNYCEMLLKGNGLKFITADSLKAKEGARERNIAIVTNCFLDDSFSPETIKGASKKVKALIRAHKGKGPLRIDAYKKDDTLTQAARQKPQHQTTGFSYHALQAGLNYLLLKDQVTAYEGHFENYFKVHLSRPTGALPSVDCVSGPDTVKTKASLLKIQSLLSSLPNLTSEVFTEGEGEIVARLQRTLKGRAHAQVNRNVDPKAPEYPLSFAKEAHGNSLNEAFLHRLVQLKVIHSWNTLVGRKVNGEQYLVRMTAHDFTNKINSLGNEYRLDVPGSNRLGLKYTAWRT